MLGNNTSHFPATVKHKSEINISEVFVYEEEIRPLKKLCNNGETISPTAILKVSLYHERIETLLSTDASPELDSSSHILSSLGRGHTQPSFCVMWDGADAAALHFGNLCVHNAKIFKSMCGFKTSLGFSKQWAFTCESPQDVLKTVFLS